jgi:hypothetical protein
MDGMEFPEIKLLDVCCSMAWVVSENAKRLKFVPNGFPISIIIPLKKANLHSNMSQP